MAATGTAKRKTRSGAKSARTSSGGAVKKAGRVADAAKVPLVALGAATAGAAAGLAWGRRRRHRRIDTRDIAKAAKEVGSFGSQVGRLASELEAVRENGGGNGSRHRSPIEVVLEGLTARR
jgi:hypothetical protein